MIYRYIYKITCTAGSFKDKFYYGQHITDNLDDGYKGSGRKLCDYYKKHRNDYIKEIIAFYETDEELNQAEYDIIKHWLNNDLCLNLKDGGGNNKLSEETRKRISESLKGIHHSEEARKKMSESHKGKHITEEHKRKLLESCIGRVSPNKGNHYSEETRKRISESLKGHVTSEETKLKISKTNKGKKFSEEHKRKISESNKGKHFK